MIVSIGPLQNWSPHCNAYLWKLALQEDNKLDDTSQKTRFLRDVLPITIFCFAYAKSGINIIKFGMYWHGS